MSGFCKWIAPGGVSIMLEVETTGFVTVCISDPDGMWSSRVVVPTATWEAMTRRCFDMPTDVKTFVSRESLSDGGAIDATPYVMPEPSGLAQARECCGLVKSFTCRIHGLVDEARQFTAPDSYIEHCPHCHFWYTRVPDITSYSGALPTFVSPPPEIANGRKVWPG